jgi:hypothetical protein
LRLFFTRPFGIRFAAELAPRVYFQAAIRVPATAKADGETEKSSGPDLQASSVQLRAQDHD